MPLSAAVADSIRAELGAAPRGERAATVRRLAETYGVSPSTVYRAARVGGAARAGRKAGRPEYRDWVRVAVRLAHRAPKPIPLDLAIEGGVEAGVLPPEAREMPVSTARRVARELGLTARPRRTPRVHADYPMQAVLVDASTSEHLVAERPDGEDWVLRLHRRPWSAGGYKNKPLGPHRMRVVVYALWDMCTGLTLARYGVERGESAHGAMSFLCWALGARHGDPRIPMRGVPDELWSDQGPLARSAAARDLLERLGIGLVLGEPYGKERMGGVERSHRTRWSRFERALFLRERPTITLAEVNARLLEHEVREGELRRSRTPVDGRSVSRAAAWTALVRRRETPLRALPPDPIKTMASEARRRVDQGGLVRWGGVLYEAGGGWHSRWVIARRAMDGSGDLALEDEGTGARETARRYVPRPYGTVRRAPKAPLERLLEEPAVEASADLWAPRDTAGVAPFPARTAPAAPLEDPLDTDRLASVEEAMRVFRGAYPWPISGPNLALVRAEVERAGCSRRAVVELAAALATLDERSA